MKSNNDAGTKAVVFESAYNRFAFQHALHPAGSSFGPQPLAGLPRFWRNVRPGASGGSASSEQALIEDAGLDERKFKTAAFVQKDLAAEADVNAVDNVNGFTSLISAAMFGNVTVVRLLLEQAVSPSGYQTAAR